MAAFWLVQAVSGMAIAFRWEIDDGLLAGEKVPVQALALGSRIEALGREGSRVSALWSSSGASDRFDIDYQNPAGVDRVMRIDGAGKILRDRADAATVSQGGIFNLLSSLHSSLLGGAAGEWLVAISGALLLSNLAIGLYLGWPGRKWLRRALFQRPAGSDSARRYGWHRLVGLWLAVPVMLVVGTGVLLAFKDGISARLGTALPQPAAQTSARGVGPGQALQMALARYPGASISALSMPTEGESWFKVRLQAPGELRTNWGNTTLFIDAGRGRILADHDARRAGAARRFVNSLYPLHTGQYGGMAGRALLLAVAAALITLIIMGLRLWSVRKRRGAW